jgi:hypothetical protein
VRNEWIILDEVLIDAGSFVQQFLDVTADQLTDYGLQKLIETVNEVLDPSDPDD